MTYRSSMGRNKPGAGLWISAVVITLSQPAVCWASGEEASGLHAYAKLYPEWKVQRFGQPASAGAAVGTMGTLRNDMTRLPKDAPGKDEISDQDWSSSYAGIRGRGRFDRWTIGFDLQIAVNLQGEGPLMSNLLDNLETRDAFVHAGLPGLGRIALGKMDTAYKDFVEKGSMLGLTNGNFVSYSLVNARAGWKGKGSTTFFNRRSHTLGWFSDDDHALTGAVTHSWNERPDGPGGAGSQLTAAALRWRVAPWTVTLATEVHRNWLPMSRGASVSASTIYNDPATTHSQDQVWRLGTSWMQGAWRVAADVSRMRYAENDPSGTAGKFRSYQNQALHVNATYRPTADLAVAANYVRADAGSCSLSGEVACSTQGLGGDLTSIGVMRHLTRHWSLFGLAARMRNQPAAYFGSAPQGAGIHSMAVGVQFLSR